MQFEKFYRGVLVLLCLIAAWSVWSLAAQDTGAGETNSITLTTSSSSGGTNSVASEKSKLVPTPEWVEHLAEKLPFLKHTLWGNELWKYVFSLIYIFLAFYVSKLLDYLTRVWLKKWAERTTTKFDDLVLDLLNGPVKVVAFVILLRIGLDVFDWPETVQQNPEQGFYHHHRDHADLHGPEIR